MIRFLCSLLIVCLWLAIPLKPEAAEEGPAKRDALPVGAAVEIPAAPIPVRGGGKTNLVYELHITNLGKSPVILDRIDVSGNKDGKAPLVSYEGEQFDEMLVDFALPSEKGDVREIKPGMRIVACIWVALESGAPVPGELHHRLVFKKKGPSSGEALILDEPVVDVNKGGLRTIHSPLYGDGWLAAEGPVNLKDFSHHRFGVITMAGKPRVPQRFAVDWMKYGPNGKLFQDSPSENKNWYCYGEEIHSVADGVVQAVKDGIPDNVPLTSERAVPMTLDTLCGNYVIVDNGHGCFALYAHMKPGSVCVKAGDKVRSGQLLGLLGNSGNSDAPHLHFHLNATPAGHVLASEGLPFEIGSFYWQGEIPLPFTVKDIKDIGDQTWKPNGTKPIERRNEIPLGYRVYRFVK